MNNDDIKNVESEFVIASLRKQIRDLEVSNTKLKILLSDIDDNANPETISLAEAICVEQIEILKQTSAIRELSNDEVKNLDVLHKNLKLARGENIRVGAQNKTKKLSAKELEKIAKGE